MAPCGGALGIELRAAIELILRFDSISEDSWEERILLRRDDCFASEGTETLDRYGDMIPGTFGFSGSLGGSTISLLLLSWSILELM